LFDERKRERERKKENRLRKKTNQVEDCRTNPNTIYTDGILCQGKLSTLDSAIYCTGFVYLYSYLEISQKYIAEIYAYLKSPKKYT